SGNLTVLTDPTGAEIRIDKMAAGTTPLTIEGVAPGGHGIDIVAGQFKWSGTVKVYPNRTKVLDVDLKAYTTPPPPPPPPPPAPEPTHPAAPAPEAEPEHETEPQPEAADTAMEPQPTPEPQPSTNTSDKSAGKPDCRAVCDRFVKAVTGSESLRRPIRHRCFERCDAGELKFSICAWKARTMQDVSACMGMPESE
ncbi:MAG: PEGA domain-containing protein, partial [Deltaproteobacteria bacterium]|nr:PEGA domain-containing protein [Deltaproteobacteria bacterium]